jgi:hypothetical protein
MTTNLISSRRLYRAIAMIVAGVAFLVGAPAGAQTTTGSIRGAIRSTEGTPVTDATVLARSVSSGMVRSAVTNNEGFYNLAGLRPDRYVVSVRRIGYSAREDTV